MLKTILTLIFGIFLSAEIFAQQNQTTAKPAATPPVAAKKTNRRPVASTAEPFDNASAETMAKQCVKFETESGIIEAEMFPESAPNTVRNFLNLVATKAYDTTTFSRVVPNFVVQGGSVATRLKYTNEIINRMQRTIPDEPSPIRHERGILSMARHSEPNTASSGFFFLIRDSPHLDGTFAAFGRVTSGMDVVDAINKMPVTGEKPDKPVRLTRALIIPCAAKPAQ
jgi:peptidyl-prolyl cis-trans isomerase B (cyclophilin B)